MFLNSVRLTFPHQNTQKFAKFTATGGAWNSMKNHFLSKYEQLTFTVKFFYNFFHWQNCIRPLSEQCTVKEFEIKMSLSMAYI